ncbi:MAG: hypothetical protein IT168_29865 [Bryobacterales bacterium]|nr:hypothetical protein [Bryobacterales bacterium]
MPSIFGYGDGEALQIGLRFLYSHDPHVASAAAGYLRDYYPASQLIPALQRLQQQTGNNQKLNQLLTSHSVS